VTQETGAIKAQLDAAAAPERCGRESHTLCRYAVYRTDGAVSGA